AGQERILQRQEGGGGRKALGVSRLFRRQKSLRLPHLLFRGHWAHIVEGRMPANPVVKTLDVLKNGLSCLLPSLELVTLDTFAFECAEETFHGGIIVAVACSAHADHHAK